MLDFSGMLGNVRSWRETARKERDAAGAMAANENGAGEVAQRTAGLDSVDPIWGRPGRDSALVLLYWQVGNRIRTETLKSERAAYGEQIVVTLSRQLAAEFGNGY